MGKDVYGPDAEYFISRVKQLHKSQKEKGEIAYQAKPFLWNPEHGFVGNPFQKGGTAFMPIAPDLSGWDRHSSLRIHNVKMGMFTSVGRFPYLEDELAPFDSWVRGNHLINASSWEIEQMVIEGNFQRLRLTMRELAAAQRWLDLIFPGRRSSLLAYRKPQRFTSFEALPTNLVVLNPGNHDSKAA